MSLKEAIFEQNDESNHSNGTEEDPKEYASKNGYFLSEFGKLDLPLYPRKIAVFQGTNGVTYVTMVMGRDFVLFIIQAVFKRKEARRYRPFNNPLNSLQTPKDIVEDDPEFDELNCIQNFKMFRRCTIRLEYANPKLVESFADYFILAAYPEKPLQVDIYEKNKSLAVRFCVEEAARKAFLAGQAMQLAS